MQHYTLDTKRRPLCHSLFRVIAPVYSTHVLTHSLLSRIRARVLPLATACGAFYRLTQARRAFGDVRRCVASGHLDTHTSFSSLRAAQRGFSSSAPLFAQGTTNSQSEPWADAAVEGEELDMGTDAADVLPKAELYDLVAARLDVPVGSVRYVVDETKKGVTVPFLARYRQDETGHMDEDVLRRVVDTASEVKEVHRRRQFMLKSLTQRGLLTPALQASLERMVHLSQLEDAWEPYKERKNTLAARGREAGLGQFAEPLLHTLHPVEGLEQTVRKVEDGERLMVAILSEELQRNESLRQQLLAYCRQTGHARCTIVQKARKKEAKEMRDTDFANLQKKFSFYDGRVIPFTRMEAHSALALQRGESKGVLKVDVEAGRGARNLFRTHIDSDFKGVAARLPPRDDTHHHHPHPHRSHATEPGARLPSYEYRLMRDAANNAFEHLVKAALNTVYRDIRKSAEKVSIHVFAHNLQQMLLQRPLSQSRLLAMDPGVRNGVKCVTLNANGALTSCFKCTLLDEPHMQAAIVKAVQSSGVNKIVIGNGTASQETTRVVSKTIQQYRLSGVEFAVVSEAGASVYSASEMAKEEFPTLDIMYRGAVSIGRRVLDPLSELVKIPVRSMGIGMYQHDVNEKELSKELGRVLESCVAKVGVNAASANRYVMEQVPGIQKKVVDQIVLARHAHTLNSRDELRRVPGMTETMFQQIAGFFRFPNSKEPLDATSIHPESYELARKLLQLHDAKKLPSPASPLPPTTQLDEAASTAGPEGHRRAAAGQSLLAMSPTQLQSLASELHCGVETLRLVAQELCQPGLDPRDSLPHAGLMRTTLKDKSQLAPGDILTGVVMSVTTFGTFLDCGLHDSVLLRGRGVDRLQIGSLVHNLIFKSLDDLGRVQVEWDGVSGTGLLKEGLRQRLRLEMEDTLAHPSAAASSRASRAPATKRVRTSSPPSTSPVLPPSKRAAAEPVAAVRANPSAAPVREVAVDDAAVADIIKSLMPPPASEVASSSTNEEDEDEGKRAASSVSSGDADSSRLTSLDSTGPRLTATKSKSSAPAKKASKSKGARKAPRKAPTRRSTPAKSVKVSKELPKPTKRTEADERSLFTF